MCRIRAKFSALLFPVGRLFTHESVKYGIFSNLIQFQAQLSQNNFFNFNNQLEACSIDIELIPNSEPSKKKNCTERILLVKTIIVYQMA